MAENESSDALLRKLCDLQEQQLAKLSELVECYSILAKGRQESDDVFKRQSELWEQEHNRYVEREARHEARTLRHGAVALVILALIPIAIIIARFI
jgi:hypothetical protein